MKVLVVDDDGPTLGALKRVIERDGHEALVFDNPVDALARMESEPVDLILTDLKMPGMDGIQFLYKLKSIYPRIPVILLTGHATVDSAVEAMQWGAFDYLRKPCEVTKIQEVIGRAVEFVKSITDRH